MIRKIVQLDNPILRKKARRVTRFGADLQRLVGDMVATLRSVPGVGLAAPQIAVSQRVIVVKLPDDETLYIVANPEIVKASKATLVGEEGCLSIPGVTGLVERPEKITVKGQDGNGNPIRIKASGWLARVFQHEIDHLDGRLFIDIMIDSGNAPMAEPA